MKFNIQYLIFLLFFVFCPVAAEAFTVSPPLIEVVAEPGETLVQKIRLFNETNQDLTAYAGLENFRPRPGSNLPEYLGDNDPFGPARWIKVPVKKVTLKPGELKDILLKLEIPFFAEPGGHYAALFWSEQAPEKVGIGAASRLAILFLFKIKGEIKEELKILSFEKKDDNDLTKGFVLQLENSGNVHLKPSGMLEISNGRGEKIAEILINPFGQAILAKSQRRFELSWSTAESHPGLYSAQAKLFYGEQKKGLTSAPIKFSVAPSAWGWKIFGGGMVVVLLFLIIKMARHKAKNDVKRHPERNEVERRI